MTAGEGGIVTTNNPDLAEKCIQLRSCGRLKGESWYKHYVFPVNYRLAELLSAILIAQLERLDEQTKRKNENGKYLAEKFKNVDGINPVPGDGDTDVNGYYLYLLQYDKDKFSGVSRDKFVEVLNAEGIPCHIGYPWPLNKNPMFQKREGSEEVPYTFPYRGGKIAIKDMACPLNLLYQRLFHQLMEVL